MSAGGDAPGHWRQHGEHSMNDAQHRIREYVRESARAVALIDQAEIGQIAAAAGLLADCFRSGGAVLVCGNGGSAADAQHIAGELTGRYLRERRALNCLALSANTSNLTAIANDYSYEHVFARQVEAHLRAGDVLWAISTSGNSPNVLRAAEIARQRGGKVLGFAGGSGGRLPALCDVCFIAPTDRTPLIQQLHQLAYHIICDLVEQQADT